MLRTFVSKENLSKSGSCSNADLKLNVTHIKHRSVTKMTKKFTYVLNKMQIASNTSQLKVSSNGLNMCSISCTLSIYPGFVVSYLVMNRKKQNM